MIPALFADVVVHRGRSWSTGSDLGDVAIGIVVILALVGLVLLACQHFKVPIPPIVWNVLGIVLGAILLIWAIRFVLTL